MDESPPRIDPRAADLVPAYLARCAAEVANLQLALDPWRPGLVEAVGHDLAGSGAPFGFPLVSRIGRALLDAARTDDTARVAAEAERLAAYVETVRLLRPAG